MHTNDTAYTVGWKALLDLSLPNVAKILNIYALSFRLAMIYCSLFLLIFHYSQALVYLDDTQIYLESLSIIQIY